MQTAPLRHDHAGSGLTSAASVAGQIAIRTMRVMGVTMVAGVALLVSALAIGPRLLPYHTFTILTGSMNPTLPVGSEVILRPVPATALRVGDVITFTKPGSRGELVTHRIMRIETTSRGKLLVTKGDANGAADPWRIPIRGTGWRYWFSVPYAGYLVAGLRLVPVRIALLSLVAAALAAFALRRVWRRPETG